MATKKKTASKPVKKVAPAKKAVAKKSAPAKKTVAAKKAAPTKKTATPKKAAVAKTVKKSAPAKKADVKVKATPATKPAAKKTVAKKSVPVKKVAVKKSAPAKKAEPKKAAPTKKATVAPKREVTKKAPPAPAKVEKPSTKSTAKKAVESSKVATEKSTTKKSLPVKSAIKTPPQDSVRAEIRDAVRSKPRIDTTKPGAVIAHRVLEKKKKTTKEDQKHTMKEYNPSTRSLLDGLEHQVGPVYRYSDEELNEFKELILKRLESARENLAYYQALITRKGEAGTEDTDNRFNHMEDGSGAMEREQLSQLAARQIQFINHLEKALVRIENKTYGICRVTGKLIDKARLRAVPHATLSIEAKNVMNK